MLAAQKPLPKWVLIVSGLFALLEIMVSISLILYPDSTLDRVDLSAKGVDYLIQMWAARQFALGVILAFATFKRSGPMLSLCYIFLLVMFIGDLVIGISQKENALIGAAAVMCFVASAMLYVINKKQ